VKVREAGRVVNVHARVATGVNADGHREILGLDVASGEDGAGWLAVRTARAGLAFLRGLVARGLSGVQLVISDAHPGLVAAIGSALPGASWQRCRTHYLRNLLTKVPKSAQPHVATRVRTIFDQPDAEAVHAKFDRVVAAISYTSSADVALLVSACTVTSCRQAGSDGAADAVALSRSSSWWRRPAVVKSDEHAATATKCQIQLCLVIGVTG
jgi:transposase-like protein